MKTVGSRLAVDGVAGSATKSKQVGKPMLLEGLAGWQGKGAFAAEDPLILEPVQFEFGGVCDA